MVLEEAENVLDISHLQTRSLPHILAEFTHLLVLNLSFNEFEDFPKEITLDFLSLKSCTLDITKSVICQKRNKQFADLKILDLKIISSLSFPPIGRFYGH